MGKVIELKSIESINPNKEALTLDKLKTFKGLENLTDEEAQETLFCIQTFSSILYAFINEQTKIEKQNKEIEFNQQIKIAA
ncbi:MAG: hypothetical protein H0X46_00075 [Bacteroidetes bacterium]|nr:hypothetical protein [Bacteroidota bacterium]